LRCIGGFTSSHSMLANETENNAAIAQPSRQTTDPQLNSVEPIETSQVSLPNRYARAIIGPGGTKIAQIRVVSGATIHMDHLLADSDDRIITIRGTLTQIADAQYLLQTAVKESGIWNDN
jgi:hypothetical protein